MTADSGVSLSIGGADQALSSRLNQELTAFNAAATGVDDELDFTIKVTDADGELVGGLTGWTWGEVAGLSLLWVRADLRHQGWGSRLVQIAEAEARRRGCVRIVVASFTFQAPDFYRRHGYVETGRAEGFPGGHADVHSLKQL